MNKEEWQEAKITSGIMTNKFVVVMPTYNAASTIKNALLSILGQDFDDIGIIIRDDQSTDQTQEVVKSLFQIESDHPNFYIKNQTRAVLYIQNDKKLYSGGNIYDSVIQFVSNPYTIVGEVDGDDFLLTPDAISTINDAYAAQPKKWLIWSQHFSAARKWINIIGYSNPLPADEIIYSTRKYWSVSHFRTCLAGLFHLLNPLDLSDPFSPSEFAKVCGDSTLYYPFIEMCGNQRSLYVNEVLYYYNDGLPTNDAEVFKSELKFYKNYFENKQPYKQLGSDFKF